MDIDVEMHALKSRLNRLARNGKNIDSQGVIRRIKRKIAKLERGIVLA